MEEKGVKKDEGKIRMELLPPFALQKIAEVFTFGAEKYSEWNWAGGLKYSRLYGAMQRHLADWYKSDSLDKETSKSHLFHAGCCLLMLIEMEEFRKDMDDRPEHYKKEING